MPVVEQTVAEYLKRVQQRIADPFHPHPVVKAIMIAVEASKGGKDGNYVGVSGDANLHGGVPHLSYAVAIKKQGDSYDILEVKDVINGTTVSPDSIQRMIDAEIEMLNFDGDATPVDAAVQIMDRAFSPKFKVVKLDEKDRAAAIELAKWLLTEGRLKGVPSAVSREIRSIGAAADWGGISSEARSIIGTAWGTRVSPNTMVVTHVEDQIPKTKIREITATSLARFR